MPLIRIEPVLDPRVGKFFLEIYQPHDAERPFVTTQPRYASAAAAENDLTAIIAAAASAPTETERSPSRATRAHGTAETRD